MIKELTAAIEASLAFATEKHSMDEMEARCNKQLSDATALGRLDDPKVLAKIGDAPATLSMIRARRKHIETNAKASDAALRSLYMGACETWNGLLAPRRENGRLKLTLAMMPFFCNDEKAIERILSGRSIPVIEQLNRAGWNGYTPHPTDSLEFVAEVRDFLRFIRHQAKELGITLD